MKKLVSFFMFLLLCLGFLTCKKKCERVTCINSGIYNGCECVCPPEWTGAHCEELSVPTAIILHEVTLLRYPQFNGPSDWDLGNGPDLIFEILDTLGHSIYIHNAPIDDVDVTVLDEYTWSNSDIKLADPFAEYIIELWDDDVNQDDFMGSAFFIPYWHGNGFQDTLFIDEGGAVAFLIPISYEF
ncbi:MAG: calcium-binding EGF-like domain-containing protein [Bacteroidetes bacterium]|nr:calcium-binding EGF-like domain-containing protein [Bacteroidota bacterium]